MNYQKEIVKSAGIGEQYFKIKHTSGCTICLYPMEGFSTVYAMFGVNFGSIDAAYKNKNDGEFTSMPEGTAHFLEHKLFENKNGSALDLFGKTGANANAFTAFDKTAYLFYCSQKFEENLEILLNFVQDPYFTDETVEKEKGIIEQEIMMYDDDPGWHLFMNSYLSAYHNHPIRIPIAGTKESIAKIDKETLYRCYSAFYNLNNAYISIAGGFDPDKALEICDRLLKPSSGGAIERLAPKEPYEIKEKTTKTKLTCSKPMFEILYKFPEKTPAESQRAYIIYSIMLEVCLGKTSSFYTEMYEQELVDGGFSVGAYGMRGLFMCYISGDSKDPELLLGKINAELTRLRTELPDKTEFENIKKRTYGELLSCYGDVATVANSMLNAEIMGITAFDGIETAASVTYEDIVEALMAIDLDNCSISVVEPVSD